jgi:hypothetical protein
MKLLFTMTVRPGQLGRHRHEPTKTPDEKEMNLELAMTGRRG